MTTHGEGGGAMDRDVEFSRRDLLPAALLGAGALGLLGASRSASAGPLNPPGGAIGATGRTLDEIYNKISAGEAIPINQTTCPGDAGAHFVIPGSGHYYLPESVTIGAKSVIRIVTGGVTVNLNGCLLSNTGAHPVIRSDSSPVHVRIRNGTLIGQGGVVQLGNFAVLEDLTIETSGGAAGILAADMALVSGCSVSGGGTSTLISLGQRGRVVNCATSGGQSGIMVGAGSVVTGCSAQGSSASFGAINVGAGCIISGCVARNSGIGINAADACIVERCIATGNSVSGIITSLNCRVFGNQTAANTQTGISVSGGCEVRDNNSQGDGPGAAAGVAGILVTGANGRIQGNTVNGGRRGIRVTGTNNLIAGNYCRGATGTGSPSANYDIGAGNDVGAITNAGSAIGAYSNITF